jgi:hypothetical protein
LVLNTHFAASSPPPRAEGGAGLCLMKLENLRIFSLRKVKHIILPLICNTLI